MPSDLETHREFNNVHARQYQLQVTINVNVVSCTTSQECVFQFIKSIDKVFSKHKNNSGRIQIATLLYHIKLNFDVVKA